MLLRSSDDIAVVAEPSSLNIRNLVRAVSVLLLVVIAAVVWGVTLKRKVRRQTTALSARIEAEAALERHLAQIGAARSDAGIFGLIYIDLDEFKLVNDLYGHRIGDLYLQDVALRMKRQLRSHDLLARLGGDEFAALVTVVHSRAEVDEIALRLERCFDEPLAVEGYVLHGSASVGIALYPDDGDTKDSLLGAADAAMYVAKHTKRQIPTASARRLNSEITPCDRT